MFANPGILYLLCFIPAIIILHLIRRRRKRVVVSSLLIWDRVLKSSRKVFFTSRLLRNLLLVLQVCAFLLLVLSLAGLSITFPGEVYRDNLIIVLDVSAGMRSESTRGSRFDEAVKETEKIIRDLAPGKGALLMSAGKRTSVIIPYTKDKDRLLTALREIEVTEEAGNIEEALREAVSMAGAAVGYKIIVITDSMVEPGTPVPDGIIEVRTVGIPGDNLAITAFSSRRPVHGTNSLEFFLEVTNYGHRDVETPVYIEFDDGTRKRFDISVAAEAATPLAFSYDGFLPKQARAWVDYDDMLFCDNSAFSVIREEGVIRVLLVTPGNPYLESLLGLFKDVSIHRTNRVDVSTVGADIVVFDRLKPMFLEPGRYFFIDSLPPGYSFFPAGEFSTDRVIVENGNHPVTRDLVFSGIKVGSGSAYTGRDEAILSAGNLPFLSVYEGEGIRWVRLSADLFNTNLPYRPAFPILIGRGMEWLLGGNEPDIGVIRAGDPIPGGLPLSEVVVRLPDGREEQVTTDRLGRIFADTKTSGFYTVISGERERLVAVNPAGGTESDLREEPFRSGIEDAAPPGIVREEEKQVRLDGILLIFAFMLLMLEFYLGFRGQRE